MPLAEDTSSAFMSACRWISTLAWIIHEPSAANADHAQPQRLVLSADHRRISIRQYPSARGNSLILNTLHIFATKFVNNPG
jgi:hypothetical protein